MQKAHQNINWENYPSTQTPLNEQNLNKLDRAVDEIDNRVVELYGYEERVKQSEINAKESEDASFVSETNAEAYATESESYAHGGTNIRSGENTDNAKYYSEKSREYSELSKSETALSLAETHELDTAKGGIRVDKIFGKSVKSANLLDERCPFFYIKGIIRGTGTYLDNGTVTVTPNNSSNLNGYVFYDFKDLPIGTYTISADCDDTSTLISVMGTNDRATFKTIKSENGKSKYVISFSNDGSYKYIRISLGTANASTTTVGKTYTFSNIMLNKGSIALSYMPYGILSSGDLFADGAYKEIITEHGKNLIPYPYPYSDSTINGITWKINKEDGSIIANGTATATSSFELLGNKEIILNPQKTYFLSGCPKGGTGSNNYAILAKKSLSGVVSNVWCGEDGVLIKDADSIAISDNIGLRPRIASGQSINNLIFKPMLVEVNDDGTYKKEYEPYQSHTAIIPLTEPLRSLGDVKDEIDVENNRIIRRIWCDKEFNSVNYYADRGNSKQINLYMSYRISNSTRITSEMFENNGTLDYEVGNIWASRTSVNPLFAIFIPTSENVTNVESALTWVKNHNFSVLYEMETPIYEPLTTEQIEALHSLKSYEEKTYIDSADLYAKPTLDLEYASSRVGALALESYNNSMIEEIMDESAISDSWNPNVLYGVGSYFIHENKLYKVKVQCKGITPPNTNYYELTSVAEEFSELNGNLAKFGDFRFVERQSVYNGHSFNMGGGYSSHVNILNLYTDQGICKGVILFTWDGSNMIQHDIYNAWSGYGGGTISIKGATVTVSTAFGGYADWYMM